VLCGAVDKEKNLKYTIDCIGTGRGWRYRVTLWCGRVAYNGQRDYERHQDAERAAKATGATANEAHNAKVSGAGTASAGLPGYTAG